MQLSSYLNSKLTFVFIICSIVLLPIDMISKNYVDYHKGINHAEQLIFVHHKIQDGLKVYDTIFNEYDFVYVGDCINALQMALYQNDEISFLNFTQKAFQNGLHLRNLKNIKYVKNHAIYLKDTSVIQHSFNRNRSHYVNRIDTSLLKEIVQLFTRDQLNKNGLKNRP